MKVKALNPLVISLVGFLVIYGLAAIFGHLDLTETQSFRFSTENILGQGQ